MIHDGGFEGPLNIGDVGFGWEVANDVEGVELSVDPNKPHSGARSLRIDFSGDSLPGANLLSQLIPVQPSKRYRINFALRTQDLVTGGPPIAAVVDAAARETILAQTPPMAKPNTDWQMFSLEFATQPNTMAVLLTFRRQPCNVSPCPIFGSIRLDSVSIERLN